MHELFQQFLLLFVNNTGKVVGSLLGLFLGWLTLRYGFAKALFVLLCLVLGYYLGSRFDRKESLSQVVDRLLFRNRRY